MAMHPECFNGTVGCFDDYMYYITLVPEVPEVVHAPRRVPIQLKDKLQAELREMETQGIIARETRPSDWVNSLVIRIKKMLNRSYWQWVMVAKSSIHISMEDCLWLEQTIAP